MTFKLLFFCNEADVNTAKYQNHGMLYDRVMPTYLLLKACLIIG